MRKIIVGLPNCQNCNMLKNACPDAEKVDMNPADLLNFARALDIKSIPFVVCVGDVGELENELRVNVIK